MSKYFSNYPITKYKGKSVRDITRRSKVNESILNDPFIFLPYTIKEGEKPETIANLYYGSVNDTWMVLLANKISDPYSQWPMDEEEFEQYFINKYADISSKTGFDVIRWGNDTERDDNIVYYYREIDKSVPDDGFLLSSYVNVTDEQLQQILDGEIVEIDGFSYEYVGEE